MRGQWFIDCLNESNPNRDIPLFVAEIGVKRGGTSLNLLRALPHLWLHLVDPWCRSVRYQKGTNSWHEANYQRMLGRIEPYRRRVTVIRETAQTYATEVISRRQSLHWAIIDADHDRVEEILDALWPLVTDGIMGRHYNRRGRMSAVTRGVDSFCDNRGLDVETTGNGSGWRIVK